MPETQQVTRAIDDRLCEARSHFRHLMERTRVAVAVVGLDGRIVQVNPELCELLGYPEAQLLQMGLAEVTHPDDRGKSRADFARMVDGTLDRHQTIKRYVHRDGRVFYCRRRAVAAPGTDGRPRSILVIIEPVGAV